jgi:hypothetical protein
MVLDIQPVVVAAVLAFAGWFKVFGRIAAVAARRSALPALVGKDRAFAVYRAVGVTELLVALGLLVSAFGAVAASVLCAGMLGYLVYVRVAAPQSSCGCLGSAHSRVGWRTFTRTGLLAGLALLSLWANEWWWSIPGPLWMVALGEVLAVFALSPELDRYWLLPLRRWRMRVSHPLAGQPFDVPLESTVQQLRKSTAYRSVVELLRSDVLDSWDEDEWRILTFSARRANGPATAVFAVPRLRYDPELVRVVLVADELQATV